MGKLTAVSRNNFINLSIVGHPSFLLKLHSPDQYKAVVIIDEFKFSEAEDVKQALGYLWTKCEDTRTARTWRIPVMKKGFRNLPTLADQKLVQKFDLVKQLFSDFLMQNGNQVHNSYLNPTNDGIEAILCVRPRIIGKKAGA